MIILIIPNAPRMTARHYLIAKTLVDLGHEVHYIAWELPTFVPSKLLAYATSSVQTRTYKDAGFMMHSFRHLPYFWPIVNKRLFQKQLRRVFQGLHADFIFAEGYTNDTEVPSDLAFIYDLADDYAGWGAIYGTPLHKIAFGLLDVSGAMRRQCAAALGITVVSHKLQTYAKQYNHSVSRLPNGITAGLVKNLDTSRKQAKGPHSLVYASGFGQWSRVIETMEFVTTLRTTYPDISLRLIGDGTEVAKIKEYILSHDAASYIEYLGFISDQRELFSLMQECAIGLNISDKNFWRDASFPMKVIDYCSLGMPVISTNLEEVTNLKFPNIFTFNNTEIGFIEAVSAVFKLAPSQQNFNSVRQQVLREYDWTYIVQNLVATATKALEKGAAE